MGVDSEKNTNPIKMNIVSRYFDYFEGCVNFSINVYNKNISINVLNSFSPKII